MGNIDTLAPEKTMVQERQHTTVITKDPWSLTEKGQRLAREMREKKAERDRLLRTSTQPCPVDRKESKFVDLTGSFQIVVPVYKCPDGHVFSWRAGVGPKLLSYGETRK